MAQPIEQPTPPNFEPSEASPGDIIMPQNQNNPQNNAWANPQSINRARQPTSGNPDQSLTNQGSSFGMAPPTFPQRQNNAPRTPRPAGKSINANLVISGSPLPEIRCLRSSDRCLIAKEMTSV